MPRQFSILGGDTRQRYLARLLQKDGFPVAIFHVPGLADTASLHDCIRNARAILLPLPALSDPQTVRGDLSLPDILKLIPEGCHLFGGKLDAALPLLSGKKLQIHDYLHDESLTVTNAALTAECFLPLLIEKLPMALPDAKLLLLGYGRIGKVLSEKLRLLGASLTVSARKPCDLAAIRAGGVNALPQPIMADLSAFDAIINTVPAPILTASQLSALSQNTVFFDLASAPGGLPAGISVPGCYFSAPALPGRFAPLSCARAMQDCIFRTLSKNRKKEEELP